MRGLLALPLLASGALAIWPLPVSYTSGNQVLWIDSNVRIAYSYASTVYLKHWALAKQELT